MAIHIVREIGQGAMYARKPQSGNSHQQVAIDSSPKHSCPDKYDIIGVLVALPGVCTIYYAKVNFNLIYFLRLALIRNVILRYAIEIMGVTKSALFRENQNKIASLAKAFDHPARVAIIEHLLDHQTCICTDLVNVLPLSQTTITQHLRELKRTGIIKGEIEGPRVNYCIDAEVWEEARDIFLNLFSRYVPGNKCC